MHEAVAVDLIRKLLHRTTKPTYYDIFNIYNVLCTDRQMQKFHNPEVHLDASSVDLLRKMDRDSLHITMLRIYISTLPNNYDTRRLIRVLNEEKETLEEANAKHSITETIEPNGLNGSNEPKDTNGLNGSNDGLNGSNEPKDTNDSNEPKESIVEKRHFAANDSLLNGDSQHLYTIQPIIENNTSEENIDQENYALVENSRSVQRTPVMNSPRPSTETFEKPEDIGDYMSVDSEISRQLDIISPQNTSMRKRKTTETPSKYFFQ